MIRGADVLLYVRTKNGEDEFHAPVWRETPVTVHNVLIGEPDADAVVSDLQLCGRRLAYVLAIPKGDTNECDGRVLWPEMAHLRRCDRGHRGAAAACLE